MSDSVDSQQPPGPSSDDGGHDSAALHVRLISIADLPTRFGTFRIAAFWNNRDGKDHVAIIKGSITAAESVPTRLHSECLTGDALGSLRCDCRDQLEAALRRIEADGQGLILYLRQEGRGIGLLNKIRAYALQDQGMDTVDANLALGFKADQRDFGIGAQILRDLNISKMKLMTNNPKKRAALKGYGLEIVENVPIETIPNKFNETYLKTKRDKMGHELLGKG